PASKGAPAPVVPCDQWDPTSGGGCRFYGILEGSQPPPGFEHIYRVNNAWAGDTVIVYAGSLSRDENQGIVAVTQRETGVPLGEFRSGASEGAFRVISAEGNTLNLRTTSGTEY